ncbi:MAG: NADP-dependent oxidoreductase [Bacteroidota bacterium]
MKAVRIHSWGGPEVMRVEDAPLPVLADDDVLVRVVAAAVNPVDWKIRQGYLKDMLPHKLPLTLGWDVSGVVAAVGAKVTAFKIGDEVYSRPDISRDGAYAEYIAVRESELAPKPASLDHVHAAAVPLVGLTAWQAMLENAGLQPGQTVLIHAAAGGVGTIAVQLAKWKGARVIATASAANHDYLRALGADVVVDYRTQRFEDAGPVDVVFDLIGGKTQERSWSVVKPGGALVSVVAPPPEEAGRKAGARALFTFIQPNAGQLRQLAALIDAGTVKVSVEARYPLAQAVEALERVRQGHTRGKVVLEVGI